MNSYYNKKEFNEWIMYYLLDAIEDKGFINKDTEPEWAEFIDQLSGKGMASFIRLKIPSMSVRMKTYAKPPIKAVKDASENIRIMT